MSDRNASTTTPARLSQRARIGIFALLTVACLALATGYVVRAVRQADDAGHTGARGPLPASGVTVNLAADAEPAPTILFRNIIDGEHYSQIAALPVDGRDGPRRMLPLGCDRFYFAADRGICLASADGFITTYAAYVVDAELRVLHTLPMNGIPSRTRVSPDGRYGATTFFVAGHSYAEIGFSTETTLIDLRTGASLGNVEEFTVLRDGERFDEIDFNFWGITFADDSNRFYATLGSSGSTYLVEGDVAARTMRVLRDNVECPSLSPDNTRVAFKKQVGGGLIRGITWRFHVLDLETMEETPLAETRSIDDQIEWLDDEQVLYGTSDDLWTVPADGSGEPRIFLSKAVSPTVLPTAPSIVTTDDALGNDVLELAATDLAIAVEASSPTSAAGDEFTFTMMVTNAGETDATDVRLGGALPAGLAFGAFGQPATQLAGGYSCTFQNGFASCAIYSLASGASWTNTFTATVTADATGKLTTRFSVVATEPDPQPDNNRLNVELAVGVSSR